MNELLGSLLSSPEQITEIINEYKPLLYAVCKEFFGIYKDLLANDEWFEISAKYDRKKFNALIAEGFTEDQAMEILITDMKKTQTALRNSNASVKVKN